MYIITSEQVKAARLRSIRLKFNNTNDNDSIIWEVLHLRTLSKNVLLVSQLDQKGILIVFGDGKVVIL